MTKTKDKDNKTNDLTLNDLKPDLDDIFTRLVKDDPKSKQKKFYLYYLFGFPIKTCADLSGYSESYSYKLVEKYKDRPSTRTQVDRILNAFPEHYRAICRLRLPQIAEIDGKALDEYGKDPRLAVDKPQLLKQLKQCAGIDMNEVAPTKNVVTINYADLRMLHSDLDPNRKAIPVAEVIEDNEGNE